MAADRLPDCTRCGKPLQPTFQFCPECGLPASGGSVLSSEIGQLGTELRAPSLHGRPPWRRYLVPTASAVIMALVLGVGLLLFNRPLIEMFFPPAEEATAAPLEIAPRWEPQWVRIPAGTFYSGPPFDISDADLNLFPSVGENVVAHHITNGEWMRFLLEDEAHLRSLGVWEDAIPRYGAGWTRDPSGRPVIYRRDPETGEPDFDALVEDVELPEIELYRRWVTEQPGYRIAKLGITNERWLAFLESEQARLRAEGIWERVIPDTTSGWRRDSTGFPVLPPGPEVDVRVEALDALAVPVFSALAALPALAAADGDREAAVRGFVLSTTAPLLSIGSEGINWVDEVADATSLVQGVTIDAIRRYHEWASRWDGENFLISRYEIRNALWRDFLAAEEASLRSQGLWSEAVPGRKGGWVIDEEGRYTPPASELDMPVRNVSARAVRAFGRYLTARLGEPGIEIRMPTPPEWEYAARGQTWNVYPWGDSFPGTPVEGTGDPKTRRGIDENGPLQVDHVDEDESPCGVVALGVNVAEWVEAFVDYGLDGEGPWERRYVRTEIRGASFRMGAAEAEHRAQVWVRSVVDPRSQFPYAGVRLVKVRSGP